MPRHFLDPEGAAALDTESYLLTRQATEDAVADCAIAVIQATPGSGRHSPSRPHSAPISSAGVGVLSEQPDRAPGRGRTAGAAHAAGVPPQPIRDHTDVLAAIPAYHAIYANADPNLIGLIDEVFAHGNLRNGAAFTSTAVRLIEQHDRDRLAEQITRNAFALHGGGGPNL
jgi:hypothetical protein